MRQGSGSASLLDHIEGRCSFLDVELGPSIHANDSFERRSGHEHFTLSPRVTVSLMLEGDLDAAIDGQPLWLSARSGPSGHLWVSPEPLRLDRWTRAGQRIRKVNISLPYAQFLQFTAQPQPPFPGGQQWAQPGLQLLTWQPNAQSLRFAEEIFAADEDTSATRTLNAAIAALCLLRQALTFGDASASQPVRGSTSVRDARRARAVREFIVNHVGDALSMEGVAQHTNMSESTLQRVFKSAYGMTVMEFVRTRRLEMARMLLLQDGITVGEAAHGAGYSSTANFSTAFQREFGYPPSACTKNSNH